RAYFGLNDRDKALSEALEVLQTERKPNTRATVVVPARIVAARIYEDRGLHAKAMEQANMALSMQPQNPDASLIRARALIGINDLEKALPELEDLVKKFPQMNDARLQLGGLYLAQREYDKAEEQFQAVTITTPPIAISSLISRAPRPAWSVPRTLRRPSNWRSRPPIIAKKF